MATNETNKIFILDTLAVIGEDDIIWQDIAKTIARRAQIIEITKHKDIERAERQRTVPANSVAGVFAKYIAPSVLAAFIKYGEVCKPSLCACGNTVRLVLNHEQHAALCPVCGCVYPYAFYNLKTHKEFTFINSDSLIVSIAGDACEECGESKGKPPCRCQRKRMAELNKLIAAEWGTIDSHSDNNTHSQVMERIKPLQEELAQLDAACRK